MAFMWFNLCNNVAFDELNNLTKLVKYVEPKFSVVVLLCDFRDQQPK